MSSRPWPATRGQGTGEGGRVEPSWMWQREVGKASMPSRMWVA